MQSRLDWENHLRQMRLIDPRHQEYPVWCNTCGGRFSIYRPPQTAWVDLHVAAARLHRELSPSCPPHSIRVAAAVPYGEAAPGELEEHADSPFIQAGALGGSDDPEGDTRGTESVLR